MTWIVFVLVVVLFWRLWLVERRLHWRIDSLSRTLATLMQELHEGRSEAEAGASPSASRSRESTAAPVPVDAEGPPPIGAPEVPPDWPIWEPEVKSVPTEAIEEWFPEDKTGEADPGLSMPAPPEIPPIPAPPVPVWSERWQEFKDNVDWEQFTGVKLFAWLGGLALFIAAGFFVKYSIDRNLIPPALRLAIGALTGIALIIAAGRFHGEKFRVMRHTLAAGGIGVLYSVVFAATLYYGYISKPMGFGLLALVSTAAFVLAVQYRGLAIAILGALGAYAAPLLVSLGQGSLLMLLAYLAVVNAGLYQVVQRLRSSVLLLTATAGTLITLFLGTWELFAATPALIIASAWIGNLILFSAFLWLFDADPEQDHGFRWSGRLVYLGSLSVAVFLIGKPGWAPLFVVTASQAGAMGLAWRRPGWVREVLPFGALGFLTALAWVVLRFEASRFSAGFILLLCYGALGGLGPMILMWRYGLNRIEVRWLQIFPVAMVAVILFVLFRHPHVSLWFWPLLLGLVLVGTIINLIFHAFIQVGLLMLFALIGGVTWLFRMPAEMVGIGFFIFTMAAGVILCATVFGMLTRLPGWLASLGQTSPPESSTAPMPSPIGSQGLAQWLAAAPPGGICLLLAASFAMPYPMYPHPGMVTLICFLTVILFAVHRMRFEIPGVVALLAAVAAQAVSVFRPAVAHAGLFPVLVWSGALFLMALPAPFLFFRSCAKWRRLWCAWALFEGMEGVFVLYTSQVLWPGSAVKWTPILLLLLKLPSVTVLLRRLEGQPERNLVLAFHGGTLLFYLSAVPVLALNHGWIGLSLMFEAAALLWLNRRIEHPGLRWVSAVMAPAGLLILLVHLPQLKAIDSLPIMNPAVLSVAACFTTLVVAVRWAAYPRRQLRRLDLPTYYQWLAVATGFFLVNLIIADAFAQPGQRFRVWPDRNFLESACYALAWVASGAVTWRLVRLPRTIRWAGLIVVGLGSVGLIGLPFLLPGAAAGMFPFFNAALIVFLLFLAIVYYLFIQEHWDDQGSLIKNLLLALFLIAGFVAIKFQSSTIFQAGYPFTLFSSHSLTHGAVSTAGWFAYGLGLLIWPRRLDRPFRLAGLGLILIGMLKALALPFRFRVAFAAMTPVFNLPSLVYLFCLAALTYLTLRPWDARWPISGIRPKVLWGIALAVCGFGLMNIEIAGAFANQGRPFSMLTHGSLAMQLAYSIGWLVFATILLVVGIRWDTQRVRWAAIAAIVITAFKIFIRDLWSLGQLYRVGSLFGLAVVLILVSFLYQRFLSEGERNEE